MENETNYIPSAAVGEALAAALGHGSAGQYRSAWEEQLQKAMDQILNRKEFQYDLNGDALYQQYRNQAVRSGRLAMLDTMGQAAALTGGYGNTYAQTVGQQAYGQELAKLNDRIPELYQMALEQYRLGSQNLLSRYELLSGREQQDYDRYRDGVSAWQKEDDRLWQNYRDARDFDYGAYRDRTQDAQWQAQFDEAKRRYDQEWADAHPTAEPVATVKKTSGSSDTLTIKEKLKQKTGAAIVKPVGPGVSL